jgi:hypothetical protein
MLFNSAAALFAVYMLARHVPLAYRALRSPPAEGRGWRAALFPVFNVVLALAILVVAVKGLAGALMSR